MRFGWARTGLVALAGALALAACGRADAGPSLEERAQAAAYFMETNATAEGVRTLPSGVQYKIVESGPAGGARPDGNDLVRVDYEGSLIDGRVFDSSFQRGTSSAFHLDQVVPGWTDALQQMSVGDEWILYIPPELGYGAQGGGQVPPNAVLVFRVRLLDIAPVPGAGRAPAALTANG